MLVCVTGGTGHVGSHSVAALVRAGCEVRLLVRDASAVDRALAPLGIDPGAVQVRVGDVRDRASVADAVRGADGLLHAASVYSFDSRRAREMRHVNVTGTEVVLDAAVQAGVRRIVHVSSVAALFPSPGRELDVDTPVGRPRDVYAATKAAAEEIALRHREAGAPVVVSCPPALLGPHDPHRGDQATRLRDTLRGLMPMWPRGGFPMGDVRDTAALHAMALTGQRPAHRRVFGPGRHVSTRQYVETLRAVTGRRLPALFVPGAAVLPVGRVADLLQKVWPRPIPAAYGAVYTCVCDARVAQDAPTLGIPARSLRESLGDTVRWLRSTGELTARQAGSAAS